MPDYTISTPHNSTPNAIPTGVYDLDTLKKECEAIGIKATRPNIRRIRRAMDLHESGAVKPFGDDTDETAFFVKSQSEPKSYIVLPRSGCNCPDAVRMSGTDSYNYIASWNRFNLTNDRCKHEMAVALFKAQRADQAEYFDSQPDDQEALDQWADEKYAEIQEAEANAHACYPECY